METAAQGSAKFEPFVSVIIRSKDRYPYLMELLDRVLSQGYRNFEVVVIDSTKEPPDDEKRRLEAIVARDPRVRIFPTPPRGCPAAANEGVVRATGEILVFIDDDDLPIGTDWLWTHVRNFRDPDCIGVNGFHVFPTEHRIPGDFGKSLRWRFLLSHGPFKDPYCFAYDERRKVGIDYLMGGNMSLRRSAALLGGGWDEFLDYHDEHSMFLRLNKRKSKGQYMVYDPDAKMEIRKDVPGGLDARFSGETHQRVDTLAKYFLWVVGREHPVRIYGLSPVFVAYFAMLSAIAGADLAAGRDASRVVEFVRGLTYGPVALAKHVLSPRPVPHDGF
jgi:glycosyltransferase involved in cell wall biosynthesis